MLFSKMKLPLNLLPLLLISHIFCSCNNDLDVIDDYRETPVIYGLLNPSDTIQYVRIQKAYLGKGNALIMAQNSDSIYYDKNDISVNLEELLSGIFIKTIPLVPIDTFTKNDGLFVNTPHLIYATPVYALRKDATYKLVFVNNQTGKTVTGTTGIVGTLEVPTALAFPYINIAGDNPLQIKFSPVTNAKVYGLHVIFNYAEKDTIDPGNNYRYKSLDFKFADIVNSNSNSNILLNFLMKGDDFYSFIGSHIPINKSLKRPAILTTMNFVFTIGAEDFYIYYSVNQPSSNITQSIPDFTNLSNGKGVFSSRNKTVFNGIKLNDASIDTLVAGKYTHDRFDYQ